MARSLSQRSKAKETWPTWMTCRRQSKQKPGLQLKRPRSTFTARKLLAVNVDLGTMGAGCRKQRCQQVSAQHRGGRLLQVRAAR